MAKIIQRLTCEETAGGFLLTWDIADGVFIRETTVYGINADRTFKIDQLLVPTGRCLIPPENYGLATSFKVSVVTTGGEFEVSDTVEPQRIGRMERMVLDDVRKRFEIKTRNAHLDHYDTKLLLRKIDGEPCEICGSNICSGRGGSAVSDYCPVCLGTGITDPYILYPITQWMQPISPTDDSSVEQYSGVDRTHPIRSFLTTADIRVLQGDHLVIGNSVYRVLQQKVNASVGSIPAVYSLTTMKIPPEDPRHTAFIALSKGVDK